MTEASEGTRKERTLTGRVTSAQMHKTVAVVVERMERHPLYGKFLRRSTRLLAHDEANECRRGDLVTIAPCRPLSKHKAWRVTAVVERPGAEPEAVVDGITETQGTHT